MQHVGRILVVETQDFSDELRRTGYWMGEGDKDLERLKVSEYLSYPFV